MTARILVLADYERVWMAVSTGARCCIGQAATGRKFECAPMGQVCVGQTRLSVETRIKEYHRNIVFYHPEKSNVADNSKNLCHRIEMHVTVILVGRMDRFIMEAIETELHPNNKTGKKSS